jgi:hypothetical protein
LNTQAFEWRKPGAHESTAASEVLFERHGLKLTARCATQHGEPPAGQEPYGVGVTATTATDDAVLMITGDTSSGVPGGDPDFDSSESVFDSLRGNRTLVYIAKSGKVVTAVYTLAGQYSTTSGGTFGSPTTTHWHNYFGNTAACRAAGTVTWSPDAT